MAKALIGYLSNDRRSTDRLAADNARLRARIGEYAATFSMPCWLR